MISLLEVILKKMASGIGLVATGVSVGIAIHDATPTAP